MRREDLSDLAMFLAVAEEKSFTRGAIRLGLSQATLSQTISNFEQRLGYKLLARTTRSVRTTEAGQRLLDKVRPAFADIDAEMRVLAETRDTPSGSIRLTAILHPAQTRLLPALGGFARPIRASKWRFSSITPLSISSRAGLMRASGLATG